MYYWDLFNELFDHVLGVSVVVRRMYYWDALKAAGIFDPTGFSSC